VKALPAAACVALGLVGAQVLPVALEGAPLALTHRLTQQCAWERRAWFAALAPGARAFVRVKVGEVDEDTTREIIACHVRRGLANPQGSVNVIMRKWPSEAELTAWRAETWEP
jgi:hypothetical protein